MGARGSYFLDGYSIMTAIWRDIYLQIYEETSHQIKAVPMPEGRKEKLRKQQRIPASIKEMETFCSKEHKPPPTQDQEVALQLFLKDTALVVVRLSA